MSHLVIHDDEQMLQFMFGNLQNIATFTAISSRTVHRSKLQFIQFLKQKIVMISRHNEFQSKSTIELGYMYHLGPMVHQQWKKEKKEEIWLGPMTNAPTPTEKSKKQRDNIKKTPSKTSITQRLWADLGRSVGVTAVTPLVWLNRFTSAQPPHSPQK